ncbi:mandelate racemase/muconate lactonizing enzyme family protein [Photobacterium satsumensis]|uniref:mandelate racemase/muconate lactonizing enzyme family protein n=1 Tax=Photobacterium satsumensis TaxID=2910239 RepID=UPI003D0DCD8A
MSKIENMSIFKAVSPLSQPIADSTHSIDEIGFYVVRLQLTNGVVGEGYLLSFHYSPNAIEGALKDLREAVTNYHCFETGKFIDDISKEHEYFGHDGIQKWALATINIAMWDAYCKTLKQPIWKLLGNTANKVPVYGSGGWLSYTDQELIEEVTDYKNRGFGAVKIKVGTSAQDGGVERDLERLQKVRDAVGTKLNIMMDANQGMNVPDAIKLSTLARDLNIHWFEEPVNHMDFSGFEIIRQKTGIALAMGEREYNFEALKSLISRNALDLWQPDIVRIGGVDAWLESAALAKAHNIPVLPHYYKDYDVPLLCTISNGYGSESFDWIDNIIDNKMEVKDGFAYPREGDGWGFNFLDQFLTEVK